MHVCTSYVYVQVCIYICLLIALPKISGFFICLAICLFINDLCSYRVCSYTFMFSYQYEVDKRMFTSLCHQQYIPIQLKGIGR